MAGTKNNLVILLVFLVYAYFTYAWPGYWNTNEYSRMFLTRALVDYHKFEIDEIIIFHNTQDKSFFGGHFYTNKAPGSSFLAVPLYGIVRFLEIRFDFFLSEEQLLYLIKTFTVSLPSALFLLALFGLWGEFTKSYPLRRAFIIAYALGTIAWCYSSLFYGHQLTGICLFLAFGLIFRAKKTNSGGAHVLGAGIFCGGAFLIEYPSLLISILLFVYLVAVFRNLKAAFLFICGAALLGGVALFYHARCFGGPFRFPYYFETYPQFALDHSRGLAGVTWPRPGPLLKLLISPFRGIFYCSPFLIAAAAGCWRMVRNPSWRREGWLFIAMTVVYLLFFSGFSDWEGGWSMGPRHLVPLLPFWATAIVFLFAGATVKTARKLLIIVTPLILVSVVFAFLGTVSFPYFPKEFKNPLHELSLSFIFEGKTAPSIARSAGLKGIISLLPLVLIVVFLLMIMLNDLSRIFSRNLKGKLFFAFFCVLGATAMLFLWDIWSKHFSESYPTEEMQLRRAQERRIISYTSDSAPGESRQSGG